MMSAFRFSNPTGTLPIEGGVSLAPGVTVPNWGLRFRFSRSSGPGGQNVNKVNTKAEAWLRVDAIHGMRAADLERLRQQADRFLAGGDGVGPEREAAQRIGQDLTGLRVVVHHQRPDSGQVRDKAPAFNGLPDAEPGREMERAPGSGFALYPDVATHHLH